MKIFPELWEKGEWTEALHIIADKGYDFSLVRKLIRSAGKHPVIPRREGAACPGVQDKQRYKTRFAIEHFFGRLKENKRMALRFDKLDSTFFSSFALACLKILNLLC
jgi:transposase